MTRDQIELDVIDLLHEFGPDGHIDGYDEITTYICGLLEKGVKVVG